MKLNHILIIFSSVSGFFTSIYIDTLLLRAGGEALLA